MRLFFSISLLALASQGCANYPSAIDSNFGSAVRQVIAEQTANPNPQANSGKPAQTDGQSAKSAVDRYQKSFDVLPLPTNVFNIGVGSGTSSGAR